MLYEQMKWLNDRMIQDAKQLLQTSWPSSENAHTMLVEKVCVNAGLYECVLLQVITCEPHSLWRFNIIQVARLEQVSEGYEPQVARLVFG